MKLSFLSLFLACAVLFAAGSGNVSSWQSFGGFDGEAPVFTVLESDQTHMLINVSLPGFRLSHRPAQGQIWSVLELPGCYPQGDPGLPALPSVTRLFAMPMEAEAIVTVESVTSTVYNDVQVFPRQRDEIDMDHPEFPFAIREDY